jgi:hypothetical protein
MSRNWDALYRMQDWALAAMREAEHGLYLTGGTALSRGYYRHRYSEDLDLFANDAPDFPLWRDRCLEALRKASERDGLAWEVTLREPRFGRAFARGDVTLKLEFVNDVPCRIGAVWEHSTLGRLDTKENILSNKVSALVDRQAPKDVADIYWLCCRDGLSLNAAVEAAEGKAAGLYPPLVAKALLDAVPGAWPVVPWQNEPPQAEFEQELHALARLLMEGG